MRCMCVYCLMVRVVGVHAPAKGFMMNLLYVAILVSLYEAVWSVPMQGLPGLVVLQQIIRDRDRDGSEGASKFFLLSNNHLRRTGI